MTALPGALPHAWGVVAADLGVPASWTRTTHLFDVVTSTNDVASALASAGAPEGTMVVAGEQTAGRGRRGRSWSSPSAGGVYFSVVLRPGARAEGPDTETMLWTLMAAVAVADGIERASGLRPDIKWPNDLGVARPATAAEGAGWRKLAGILAEGVVTGGTVQHVVLGVGINVARANRDVRGPATSIEEETGVVVSPARLWACCAASLARRRGQLTAEGPSPVLDAWRARAPSSVGSRVSWRGESGPRTGWTAGIDDTGALRVESLGEIVTFVGGELSWEDLGRDG